MDDDYTKRRKQEIVEWQSGKPGYVANKIAKLGDIIFWAPKKAAERIVPESVQTAVAAKVAKAIEAFLAGLNKHAAGRSIDATEICKRVEAFREGNGHDLKSADEAARHYWKWHVGYAAAEGRAMGAVGPFGLAADVPALLTVALRLIQQIGVCYGYDVQTDDERAYVLHILKTGSTTDLKAKAAFLLELKEIERMLLKVTWKKMAEAYAKGEIGRDAALAALKASAKSLGVNLTKRKALQMVPIAGAAVGGSFNAMFVNDIGRAAYNCYGRRWLAERGGWPLLPPPT